MTDIPNTIFKRTNVSGKLPNTSDPANTSYIAAGQFSFNITDKKMISSNGTTTFEVGANVTNLHVSNTANIKYILANNIIGFEGQVLKISSNGIYWGDSANSENGYTGSQGSIGFTGSAGTIGFTGSRGGDGLDGIIGFTGSQGTQGYSGSKGETGLDGNIGFTGSIGNQGDIGFTGSQGNVGFTGSKGDTGAIGFTGSQGDIGSIGFTGSKGTKGDDGGLGFTGSQGIGFTGSKGDIGFTGSKGDTGSNGFTGSKGDQGNIGFTGSQGTEGNAGFTGSQGNAGNSGFTGSQGIQGNIGFVGSQGITGFTGSKGDVGNQGIQGDLGFTGSTGFTGSKGDTGTIGFTGTQGIQGFSGSQGFTGSQGEQGNIGFTGSQGNNGNVGFTGSKGDTGNIGFTGSKGDQGVVGFTGSQGIGFTGSSGIIGYTGSSTTIQNVITRIRRNSNQSIPTGASYTNIDFTTSAYQEGGVFWTTGSDIIIPENGYYQIFAEATFDGSGLATIITANMQILLEGGLTIAEDEKQVAINATASLLCIAQRFLSTGDVIQVQVKHTNVASVDILAQGDHSPDIILNKINGTTGYTGSQGNTGGLGFTGSKGDIGNTGFTGSQGITIDDADPLIAPVIKDDFDSGSGETGEIGVLNWSFTNGTRVAVNAEDGHNGIIGHRSSTTANQVTSMYLGSNISATLFLFKSFDYQYWVIRAANSATDCAYQIGIMSSFGALTPNHGCYFERLSTDTNWFYVITNGGASTRVDSTIAFDTSWKILKIRRISTTQVGFTINTGSEVIVTGNIPDDNDAFNTGLQLTGTTTTKRDLYIDFFSQKLLALTRA